MRRAVSANLRAAALGVLLAVVTAGVVSACGSGSPASAVDAAFYGAHPCKHEFNFGVVDSAPSAALVAALPVLRRAHTPSDVLPRNSLPLTTLDSLGSGIELNSSQLVRSSPYGGRAWIVPVQHFKPPVARDLACLKRQIAMQQQFVRENPRSPSPFPVLSYDRARERADKRYLAAHPGPGQPGVIVFTTFNVVQGADAGLGSILAGKAFTTGECAGPGHNLLTVSGLAPAGTASIELRSPDGATLTQPVGNGAYSFVFAPAATSAGLPNRLVLLDRGGRTLRRVAMARDSFSTNPQCEINSAGGRVGALPAGDTVIASSPRGPDGIAYTIGVSSTGGTECEPLVSTQLTDGGSGRGTDFCRLSFTPFSLTPTFTGGGCGPTTTDLNGSVSSRVKRLRFVAADGRTYTAPVFAVPPTIAPGYGVVLVIGPTDILATDPTIQSLAANGRVLATETRALQYLASCYTRLTTPPAKLLAPGIVTVVSGTTPHHTPFVFSLQRVRYGGHALLCPQQTPQGSSQCFPYTPADSTAQGNPPLSQSAPVLLTPGGDGTCTPPRYTVISGLVMRPGLNVWLKTPDGTRRIALAVVSPLFGVPGGAFATMITRGPVVLVARNAAGKTVYTTPVTNQGDKPGFCGGLDGGNPPLTPAEARLNITPRLLTRPIG